MSDVLVTLDESAIAEAVLPHAAAVAAALGARVRLLSVVEPEPRGLTSRSERVAAEQEAAAHARLAQRQASAAAWLQAAGLDLTQVILTGSPVDTILAAAAAPEVTLVALTTNGRGGLERSGIGSVADKVMRLAERPVLLVRPPYVPVPRHRLALRQLLVPLDGSALAESALDLAVKLATAAGASLTLVRVEPWRAEGLAEPGSAAHPELAAADAAAHEQAATYLEGVRARLPQPLPSECVVLRGRAAESITGFAQHERIDLTVMTSHGHGGLRRAILGSVADRVIRAGAATLLIRPQTAD